MMPAADHPFEREVDPLAVELQLDPDQAAGVDEAIERWLIELLDDPDPGVASIP